MHRRIALAPAALVLVAGLTACSGTAGAASAREVRKDVQFSSQVGAGGVTYDPALVPVGAQARSAATTARRRARP